MARVNASAKTHYFRRGATFVYRRRVPDDVKSDPAFGGKAHFQKSLGTRSPSEAAHAAAKLTDWFDGAVSRARGSLEPVAATTGGRRGGFLTDEDLAGIRARWWKNFADSDRQDRLRAEAEPDSLWAQMVEDRENYAHGVISSFNDPVDGPKARRDYIKYTIFPENESIVRNMCLKRGIPEDSADNLAIQHALAEAEIEVLQTKCARAEGSPLDDFASHATRRGLKVPEQPLQANWSIIKLAHHCIEVRSKGASWNHKVEKAAEQFDAYLGDGRPISAVRSLDIKTYVNLLLQCPERADLRFRGHDLKAAVEANRQRSAGPYPTIAPNTIKDTHLAALKWLFSYAHTELEAIPINPATGIKVAGATKKGGTRTRFNPDELERLFNLPIFTGCRGPDSAGVAGNFRLNDHRFWAPLIMLFTGARPSEIGQLSVSDIKLSAAHPYIGILTEYDPEDPDDDHVVSMKSDNAKRTIPIHPELIRLGFGKYVEARRTAGDRRLFPNWNLSGDKRKLYSQASWIRKYNEELIPSITDRIPKPTFYSFRHTFKSRMVAAGVPSQMQNQLLGHSQIGMDGSYFADGAEIGELAAAVSNIKHDGVVLDHLIGREEL